MGIAYGGIPIRVLRTNVPKISCYAFLKPASLNFFANEMLVVG